MTAKYPQRSCLGCREVKDKGELLRFLLGPDKAVVPDILGKLPGRGAYTCYSSTCLRNAVTKRQFQRSFKGEAVVGSPDELIENVASLIRERLASYLSLANKGGAVVSGTDMVVEQLKKRAPGLLVLADDISGESRTKLVQLADKAGIPSVTLFDKARLGALLGKELRTALAIAPGAFCKTIIRETARYGSFLQGGVQST